MKRGRGGRTPRGGRGQAPDPVTPDVSTPPLAPSSAMSIDPRSGQPQRADQADETTDQQSSPIERVVADKERRRSRRLAGEPPTDVPNTASTTSNPQATQSGNQPGLASDDSPEASSSGASEGEIGSSSPEEEAGSSPPEGKISSSPPIPANGDLAPNIPSSPPMPADDDPLSEEEGPEVNVGDDDVSMHPILSIEGNTNSPEPDIQYVVTFERQPPPEIRTDTEMPTFIVSLQILENGVPGRPQFCGESSENFNAVATLIDTDGRTPTVFLGNETIMPPIPAPGVEQSSADGGVRWLFHFAPGVITASGYFQMHIAVVITRVSPPSDDEGDYMIIDSPIATLHINSRVFHVHPFAVRRVSPTVSTFHLRRLRRASI